MKSQSRRLALYEWAFTRPHGKMALDAGRDLTSVLNKVDRFLPRRSSDVDSIERAMSMALIMHGCAQQGIDYSKEGWIESGEHVTWESHMIAAVMSFSSGGRNVFTFAPDMVEAFTNTDIDQVIAKDIEFPYTAFYLNFETPEPIIMPNGLMFDGVLVTNPDPKRRIPSFIVMGVGDRDPDMPWYKREDWGYLYQAWLDEKGDVPVMEALRHVEQETTGTFPPECDLTNQPLFPGEIPQLEQIMRLVVNAVLYVMRYAADARTTWPAGAPGELVEQALAGRKSAERQLTRLGYVRTRRITLDEDCDGHAGGIRAHWRRGHWKNQPHGPKNSMRKLILVRPTRVAWKTGDDGPEMREYARRPVMADRAYHASRRADA
jgi:hypothetical protein